jgi:bifunctional non-homologous end joining protein LigD
VGLREYRQKRDFSRTPEPSGARESRARAPKKPSYLIQKHAATRLHYDFRLEMDGVLKSWALPKGPSLDPTAKRLAVHVEDHPIAYGGFEGVIPKDEYGGGTVMLWDRGWWEPVGDPASAYAKGDFKFILHGEKLRGRFVLVRMRKRNERDRGDNWLLIKERDEEARPGSDDDILEETKSVTSDREMSEIAADADRVWNSKKRNAKKLAPASAAKPAKPKPLAIDASKLPGAKRAKSIARIAPQLASVAAEAPEGEEWLHEIKYDGYRLLAYIENGVVTLRTRNDLDWTKKFPELAKSLAALPVKAALLDGEVVHLTSSGASSFAALQGDLADRKTAALRYIVFDLLHLDGWDLANVKLEARKSTLQAIIAAAAPAHLRYSDHQIGKGKLVFANAARLGLEGIVAKRRDALYRPGRGSAWLKLKSGEREELVVVGFTDPAGSRQGLGALLVGYHNPKGALVYAGRVGTGYSAKALAALRKTLDGLEQKRATVPLPADLSPRGIHWVKPELVAEVSFAGWTPDGMLREASFQGIRDDKAAADIVLDRPLSPRRAADKAAPSPAPEIGRDGAALVNRVRITHAERVLYPDDGITKLAIAQYDAEIADWILPHVARRPLSLLRCPEGIQGEHFFQKHMNVRPGDGIVPVEIASKSDRDHEPYLMIEDAKGLLALAQMGVLEIHPWGSTIDAIEKPDRIFFDLDPDEGLGWDRVVAAALEVRALLASLALQSFPKTTGGKGLHVVVPIAPTLDWDAAKEFSRRVAAKLAGQSPALYTATMSKRSRQGRIFIDYLRNGRGSTAVAAYSTRARAHATVSTPLSWAEVERGIRSDHFTIKNLPQRLRSLRTDPWAEFATVKQRVTAAMLK